MRYHNATGFSMPERRGGSRTKPCDDEVTVSIQSWISSYKCRESHYSRAKSTRSYLSPELSISKMWMAWEKKSEEQTQKLASISKFKRIFYMDFNLGFGNPRSDVCSFCTSLIEAVSCEKDPCEKQRKITELRVHRLRAKKFHQLIAEKKPGVINVTFDMQQNQPLPKLSIGEVFCARQVWLYNLTFVRQGESEGRENVDIIFLYTWVETESGRGSNEVASALCHYISLLELKCLVEVDRPTELQLFSDACSSQNKNSTVMTLLMHLTKKSDVFQTIRHTFQIRGHSYMAPDRVFGRIEKIFRKREAIITPEEYHDILRQRDHS